MNSTLGTGEGVATLAVAPLLELIRDGAAAADRERTLSPQLIREIKANPVMGFSAAREIGGLDASVVATGLELEAVAGGCASTAWVLWNHLCTFHLFAGLLGPANSDQLEEIVARREWVCFPAGASTAIRGREAKECITLTGKAAFGSGGRYAEWAGASFVMDPY